MTIVHQTHSVGQWSTWHLRSYWLKDMGRQQIGGVLAFSSMKCLQARYTLEVRSKLFESYHFIEFLWLL